MAVDASIYGLLRPPAPLPDPVDSYGKALTLRTMMGQQSLQGLQEEELRRGIGEKAKLRDLFSRNPKPSVQEIAAIDPEYAQKYQKSALENQETQGKIDKTQGELINQRLAFFRDRIPADPEGAARWVAAQYQDPVLAPHLMKTGPLELAISEIPADPAKFQQWRMAEAMGMKAFMEKNVPTISSTNLGGTTVTRSTAPLTGQVQTLATETNTQSPDSAASITAAATQGNLNRGVTTAGQNMVNARAKEANTIASGRSAREDADGLRKEFESKEAVKAYRDVVPIAEAARAAPDTRAGDIQLAYAVGKILDPASVVREGELKLVGNAATIPEQLQGKIRTLVMGKGQMTPQTRAELQAMLDSAVEQRKGAYDAERASTEEIVRRRGYNPGDVFIGTPKQKPAQPKQETKAIGGKTYVKINGEWYEE